ncbi:MAG: hypothetical protein OXG44_11200, partial [Gammaproteobacteria bacterium]|nr:hypothetical protein [Gammaproteobacteria bacterium]
VLVGQKKAVAIDVRNETGRRRWSKLDEWLRAAAGRRTHEQRTAGNTAGRRRADNHAQPELFIEDSTVA